MEPWRERPAHKCNVAIIGGGFSGTTLAAQLLRHSGPSFSVVVIEKACLPGRGLAYGTDSDSHLLNLPAKDMSAFPEDPEHFTRWAKLNFDRETQPGSFLPRRVYGRYLGDLLTDAVFPDRHHDCSGKGIRPAPLPQPAAARSKLNCRAAAGFWPTKLY